MGGNNKEKFAQNKLPVYAKFLSRSTKNFKIVTVKTSNRVRLILSYGYAEISVRITEAIGQRVAK